MREGGGTCALLRVPFIHSDGEGSECSVSMYSMGPDGEGGGEGSECSVSMYSMGTDGEGGGEGE